MFEPELQSVQIGCASVNKHDERLCGDFIRVFDTGAKKVYVLSDGLGSGIKANILSTLTSTILGTMLSRGIELDECINTVATTLPICRVRHLAYSTFAVLQLEHNIAHLVQYDNPAAIILRRGRNLDYAKEVRFVGQKEIHESHLPLMLGDTIILLSDGVTNAGVGKLAPDGWQREEIIAFLERMDTEHLSAPRIAAQIVNASLALSQDSPDDDATALVMKLRERSVVNMLMGPPENAEDDNRVLKLFFAKEGTRVICGGSTAHAVSKFQGEPLTVIKDTGTEEIPAMACMKNVDYVTEGVLTLRKTLELCQWYETDPMALLKFCKKRDAASVLASLFIEQATDVNVYFGMAANAAHEGTDINFQTKLALIRQLEECLQRMGKRVQISFC